MAKGYRGPLSPERAADGVAAALRNAKRLAEDARLLLDRGRWASAFSLAVLAIEEAGKEPLIRHILTMPAGESRERAWRAFADHRAKNVMAAFPAFVGRGARTLDGFAGLIDPKGKHAEELDDLKQAAIYVSATDSGWAEPALVITEARARAMVENAERRATALRSRSVEEYRIWVKHVAPALQIGDAASRAAVAAAYNEMAEAGLVSKDEAEGMTAFVQGSTSANDGNAGSAGRPARAN